MLQEWLIFSFQFLVMYNLNSQLYTCKKKSVDGFELHNLNGCIDNNNASHNLFQFRHNSRHWTPNTRSPKFWHSTHRRLYELMLLKLISTYFGLQPNDAPTCLLIRRTTAVAFNPKDRSYDPWTITHGLTASNSMWNVMVHKPKCHQLHKRCEPSGTTDFHE